jgi:hypothetical protein
MMIARNRKMRRWTIAVVIAVPVLIAAGIGAWYIVTLLTAASRLPEAYAAWTTADLVIDHMETHDGAWPEGWEDLFHAADIRKANAVILRWEVEELPSLVAVDWNADSAALVEASTVGDDPPFLVITRLDGTEFQVVWEGAEPNQMILDYLRARRERVENVTNDGE